MTKRTLNRNNKNKRKFAKKSRQSVGWKFSQLVTKNFVDERKTYERIVLDDLARYAIKHSKMVNEPLDLWNLSNKYYRRDCFSFTSYGELLVGFWELTITDWPMFFLFDKTSIKSLCHFIYSTSYSTCLWVALIFCSQWENLVSHWDDIKIIMGRRIQAMIRNLGKVKKSRGKQKSW